MTIVKDYALDSPIFIETKKTVADAGKLMAEKNIGALVIKGENGQIAGIFTERDFLHAVTDNRLDAELGSYEGDVISINELASIKKAVEKMVEKGIRRLLVLDGDGKAAGFLSIRDVLTAVYDDLIEVVS